MRRYPFIISFVFFALVLAGCNLTTRNPQPPTSAAPIPTVSYTPPTPYRAPGLITAPTLVGGNAQSAQNFSAQSVGPTSTAPNILTPIPAQTLIANPAPSVSSQNAIEAFVDNLIVPIWNFIYTFLLEGLATLWVFAGARGGVFAQVFCCVTPAIVLVVVLTLRLRIVRWWRR
jgi:hypothetical protein